MQVPQRPEREGALGGVEEVVTFDGKKVRRSTAAFIVEVEAFVVKCVAMRRLAGAPSRIKACETIFA
jgi:hypothetical protein